MGWLFRLVYVVVRLLLTLAVRLTLDLVGFGVRLLYWSVRTYGWGRVGSFIGALWVSLWIHQHLGKLSLSGASVSSVAVGTLGLWGGVMGAYLLLAHTWGQRAESRHSLLQLPSTRPSFPVCAPALTAPAPGETGRKVLSGGNQGTPLWEQTVHPDTLKEASRRVLGRGGGPGPDGVSVETFSLQAERHLEQLSAELRAGTYQPHPPRWVEMPKPHGGVRRLAVLSVRDRVVQQALNLTLAPLWERRFAPCSFAYRPGRSAIQAVIAVERTLAAGRIWVLDADIASFFDSVPLPALFTLLDEWLPDPRVRSLLQTCVAAVSPERGQGLAQGAPLSPLLANLYLHPMDTALLQAGHTVIRYADDFLILCATRQQAEAALQTAERLLRQMGLSLNPDKSRIVHRDEGFTFLGYTFTRNGKQPSEKGLESLRTRLAAASDEETRRQILNGWQGYFGEAPPSYLATTTVAPEGPLADDPDWNVPEWSDGEQGGASPSSPGGGLDLALYRERFVGRADVFGRYWQNDERKGYAPVYHAITDEELSAHLAGEAILGTYLLHQDGTTRALVLDVDGPDVSEESRAKAFPVAQRLAMALQRHGIVPLWVESGGKGYHLWVCFGEAVQAKAMRQWTGRWLEQFRPFPEGVLVEVFPKQDQLSHGALGSLIRMPLGRHPETGRASVLLTPEGRPADDPWTALAHAPWADGQALLRIAPWERSSVPEPPAAIRPVVEGCALLWGMVKKVADTHNLRHTERLALLYSLGHLGEAGRTYLHRVMGLCDNYDPRITERWIKRLEQGHRPLRCATLKGWLKDHLPDVTCSCVQKGANSSPLGLLRRTRKISPARPTPKEDHPGWSEVAQDLFDEPPPADEKTSE